ncbi:MAG: ABC transporter permease [Candidatus Methanomethylophilaceae archaeon]|nr:ABC transporter permease [Candidatus Methanomethylophilaceae archaeon]
MDNPPAPSSSMFSVKDKLKELYEYRNVMRSLVEKSLFGKYKNSALGFLWHFAMPIVYIVLCFFINTEVRDRSEYYWILVASGIMIFHMLSGSVAGGTTCFTGNSGIIKKMYIPKEILVFSSATVKLIITVIGYIIIIALVAISGYGVNLLGLLLIPFLLIAVYFFSVGSMLILSSINVYFRDLQYFLASLGIAFFVFSPIRNIAAEAEGIRATIFWLNPFTYYLEAFHSIIYLKEIPDLFVLGMCFLLPVMFMLAGIIVFNYLKRGFVERL